MNETCAKCGKTKEEHFEDHGGSHRVRFWCHAQGELDGRQFTPPDSPKNSESEWRELGPDEVIEPLDQARVDDDFPVIKWTPVQHGSALIGLHASERPKWIIRRRITPQSSPANARKVAEDIVHNWYLDNPEVEMPCNEMDNLKSAFTQALINFANDCGGTKDL